jgi:hypothetical protein
VRNRRRATKRWTRTREEGLCQSCFVLLMFLLVIGVSYFIEPHSEEVLETEVMTKPQSPRVKSEYGFEIPQDFGFHLGPVSVMKECSDDARVGVDNFVTNLVGKIDHIGIRLIEPSPIRGGGLSTGAGSSEIEPSKGGWLAGFVCPFLSAQRAVVEARRRAAHLLALLLDRRFRPNGAAGVSNRKKLALRVSHW